MLSTDKGPRRRAADQNPAQHFPTPEDEEYHRGLAVRVQLHPIRTIDEMTKKDRRDSFDA